MEMQRLRVTNDVLVYYARIPAGFEVRSQLSLELLNDDFGGIVLHEEEISPYYLKDHDALESEDMTRWTRNFDTSNWVLFLAREGDIPVGGATVAFRSPGVFMFGGRDDITVLWDIRVHPNHRRSGIGSALLTATANWSKERGVKHLKIETQNTNVPACRFYQKQGCRLGEINRFAYTDPRISHEVMLVWYLDL